MEIYKEREREETIDIINIKQKRERKKQEEKKNIITFSQFNNFN